MQNRSKYLIGKISELSKKKGWFFGHFAKNELLKSDLVEVAYQDISNKKASLEDKHYHTDSVEINIVIFGRVEVVINGEKCVVSAGEFYIIWPEAVVESVAAKDNTKLIVIRAPSINDKVSL